MDLLILVSVLTMMVKQTLEAFWQSTPTNKAGGKGISTHNTNRAHP